MSPSEPGKLPDKVKPYTVLGFEPARLIGQEYLGDCPLCGGSMKFHLNSDNGMFSCKGGKCGAEGNIYTFMRLWHEETAGSEEEPGGASAEQWTRLSEDRCISVALLQRAELRFDGERWFIPIRNAKGVLINLRHYKYGGKLMSLPTLDLGLYGIEKLSMPELRDAPVAMCEGEWDTIALDELAEAEGVDIVTLGRPGSGVFKEIWLEHLINRDIIFISDHDGAGIRSTERGHKHLDQVCKSFRALAWPDILPEKYDVRDYKRDGGTYSGLMAMVREYVPETATQSSEPAIIKVNPCKNWPSIRDRGRPSLEETLSIYRSRLRMSLDLEDMFRLCCAQILTSQLDGDPLWIHYAAPPGFGKTEILMSFAEIGNVISRSTVTAHSLVSGYQMAGNKDPSLIPMLMDKTFILKDFTEILQMNKQMKEEIYAILRGAYDGQVQKQFGNAVRREYTGYFNMMTGVTHAIFAEHQAGLGERSLIFKMDSPPGLDLTAQIRGALQNAGKESEMKAALQKAVKARMEYRVTQEDVPVIPEDYMERVIALAQVVSCLRAGVAQDRVSGRLHYRPQAEVGTRLAKQLLKALTGLTFDRVGDPYPIEDDMRIVTRLALGSCTMWNVEAMAALSGKDGLTIPEISRAADIPTTTLRDQMEELLLLGVVTKKMIQNSGGRGAPMAQYWMSTVFKDYLRRSGIHAPALEASNKELNGHAKQGQTAVVRPFRAAIRTKK
jgi:hypothetical protein